MAYLAPSSLQDALSALAEGDISVVAGGTDFFPMLGEKPAPDNILDITRIDGLRGIRRTDDGWRIGATTRWRDVVKDDLPPCFDGLKAAAAEVGSHQIQNVATVGGNLCNASPAADGVPPLLALEASVELSAPGGSRQVPLAEFIANVRQTRLRDGELLTALHIPALPDNATSSFVKLGSRRYLVISIAMVGVVVWVDSDDRVEGARVAVGSCSAVAQRLFVLEDALIGMPVADLRRVTVDSGHLTLLSPITDARGTADYRLRAVAELCERAIAAAGGAGSG
ncbi:FAD binding domain-containing protein [Aliiroseovarius sp. YM-037]|uniref:FAD binding domain-containing protein n=1 Tax=Aliiroseovarius sp. YM-037 TaxID=3341728 RepID=UPI003A7FC8DE